MGLLNVDETCMSFIRPSRMPYHNLCGYALNEFYFNETMPVSVDSPKELLLKNSGKYISCLFDQ